MNRKVLFALAALSMAAASGCNSTTTYYSGGTYTGGGTTTDPYVGSWYDVYGNYCGTGYPKPGCNFYADGYKISDSADPYYKTEYSLQYSSQWEYTDSYGYRAYYTGYAWLSPTGMLYDDYGRALNDLDDSSDSKDMVGEAAAQEQQAISASGKNLSDKFALAEDKGVDIARTLNDWAVLGKSRARTDNDVNAFAKRLYGVDAAKAKTALAKAKGGDLGDLAQLNTVVAAYWGTSPETSATILKNWYTKK